MNESGLLSGNPDAVRPVDPGAVQSDNPVPGEEEIEGSPQEVYVYANALAVKNGFSPLERREPEKKDPNLVLPGDRLVLPDGRILEIHPGQYIYDIAAKQYKRDMARIRILEKQVLGMLPAFKKDHQEPVKQAIGERLRDIDRLAVTPAGRMVRDGLLRSVAAAGI